MGRTVRHFNLARKAARRTVPARAEASVVALGAVDLARKVDHKVAPARRVASNLGRRADPVGSVRKVVPARVAAVAAAVVFVEGPARRKIPVAGKRNRFRRPRQ